MAAPSPWTAATTARLIELWNQVPVVSTVAIAADLAMVKNQVIGKAHRLRLPPRLSPIKRFGPDEGPAPRERGKPKGQASAEAVAEPAPVERPQQAAPVAEAPLAPSDPPEPVKPPVAPPKIPDAVVLPPKSNARTMLAAVKAAAPVVWRKCQWPLDDGKPFQFCGCGDVVRGKPYCAEHCRTAYVDRRHASQAAA